MSRRFTSGRTPPGPPAPRTDWSSLAQLLPWLRGHRRRIGVSLALLLAAKLATVALPLILRDVVDQLDTRVAAPIGLLLLYGALRLASTGFRELQSVVFAWVQNALVRQMSVRVVQHLHDLGLRFHLERHTGAVARDIGRGTSSVSTLLNYLLFNIVPTLVEVGLVATILLISYDRRFALACLITFLAYVVFTFAVTQWRLKFRTEMNALDSRATSEAVDGLLNFETVKYFGNEAFERDRYDRTLREWGDASIRSQASLSFLNVGQGLIIAAGVTVGMVLAAKGVEDGTMTLGDFVAVNAFLVQIFLPLGFLGTVYSILRHSLTDMERMFGLLALPPEISDREGARVLDVRVPSLRFDGVHFGYHPERQVLHDLSFRIEPGSTVAFVGPSGAGKSTLSRLLYRFYDVTSGSIRIDDLDVRHVTQESLRASIGIVPQDTVLFNESLLYNLQYARLDATRDEIEEAARMAEIHDFIVSLPEGYDTVVGERGLKLSGGEKQRVAIARAILKRPAILIFDEATSSLDSRSEQAILGSMRRVSANRTTIVIAHRLSTIAEADRIYVLEGGRIVEAGRHEELLERAGTYANLWRMQSEGHRADALADVGSGDDEAKSDATDA
jgi:ABC-type transport system involved in Fe-S cluster assembly fused permease/ATPase subunit